MDFLNFLPSGIGKPPQSRKKAALLFTMFLAGPASAQWTNCMDNGPYTNCFSANGAITNCNSMGSMTNCNTMGGYQQPQHNDGNSAAGNMAGFIRDINARRARAKVNKALRAGDCPTAIQEAIKGNDLDFALVLKDTCTDFVASMAAGRAK